MFHVKTLFESWYVCGWRQVKDFYQKRRAATVHSWHKCIHTHASSSTQASTTTRFIGVGGCRKLRRQAAWGQRVTTINLPRYSWDESWARSLSARFEMRSYLSILCQAPPRRRPIRRDCFHTKENFDRFLWLERSKKVPLNSHLNLGHPQFGNLAIKS